MSKRKPTQREKAMTTVSTKLSPQDYRSFVKRAEAEGFTMTSYLRQVVVEHLYGAGAKPTPVVPQGAASFSDSFRAEALAKRTMPGNPVWGTGSFAPPPVNGKFVETVLEETVSEETVSEETVLEETVSEETVSDEAVEEAVEAEKEVAVCG